MTTQEAYERMREWLGRDGAEKCIDSTETCVYLKPDGNRCAIGALLSDNAALLAQDVNGAVEELFRLVPEAEHELSKVNIDFLGEAQSIHDDNDPERWVSNLDWLAEQYGLQVVSS